jgi:UDP-N-acetylmuramate dehydrogenase
MDYSPLISQITKDFSQLVVKTNFNLSPVTTLKIGGPADLYIHSTSHHQFESLLRLLKLNSVTPTLIGNGSNVLISDSGIKGIALHNTDTTVTIHNNPQFQSVTKLSNQALRHEDNPQDYLDFTKIGYDESDSPPVEVTITSGTPLPYALNFLLNHGVTGLQWFAYIPGTIGGAIYYNIHGGNYHLNQFLKSVTYLDLKSGQTVIQPVSNLKWDYDTSEFQSHPDWIILEATFNLYQGDVARAKTTAAAWIAQKSKVQPMNSAGSVFQNPTLDQCLPIWGEQKSTGWIIDQVLGLKGLTIGGAQIGPQHANIFTNQGGATSADFMSLIDKVRSVAKSKLNLDLKLEIKLLGF